MRHLRFACRFSRPPQAKREQLKLAAVSRRLFILSGSICCCDTALPLFCSHLPLLHATLAFVCNSASRRRRLNVFARSDYKGVLSIYRVLPVGYIAEHRHSGLSRLLRFHSPAVPYSLSLTEKMTRWTLVARCCRCLGRRRAIGRSRWGCGDAAPGSQSGSRRRGLPSARRGGSGDQGISLLHVAS